MGGDITKRESREIANFTHLLELNDLAMQMYPQLRDLAPGQIAGERHCINKSNGHRVHTGMAVKRIDDSRFGFSFVQVSWHQFRYKN